MGWSVGGRLGLVVELNDGRDGGLPRDRRHIADWFSAGVQYNQ